MAVDASWLAVIGALAGPVTLALVYARQARRDSKAIDKAVPAVRTPMPASEVLPARWYHIVGMICFLAMPVVQYIWFINHRHWTAVLVPLTVVIILMTVLGVVAPRVPIDPRVGAKNSATPLLVTSAGLLVAFLLPETGTMLMLRGALIDFAGLIFIGMAVHHFRSRRNQSLAA